MKILVGSKNSAKVRATKKAFSLYFPKVEVEGFSVLSRVSAQPVGEEMFQGAENRAMALEKINRSRGLEADYLVGIEGGLMEIHSLWFISGVVCIRNPEGKNSFGIAPQFQLPDFFRPKILEGKELSELLDRFRGEGNPGKKGGAADFLSKGALERKDIYMSAVASAIIPFISKELYFEAEQI